MERRIGLWMLVRAVEICKDGGNGIGEEYIIPEKPVWLMVEAVQKISK